MREDGYYWVRYYGEWCVAKWENDGFDSYFLLHGSGCTKKSADFDEIDERRIERGE